MKSRNNEFDEMQKARRNKIGNQAFLIMMYAILIDCGLYGFGVRWLEYPGNTMAILTVCGCYYVLRLIVAGAYVPPGAGVRRTVKLAAFGIIAAGATAAISSFLLGRSGWIQSAPAQGGENNGAVILAVVSLGCILTLAVVALVRGLRADKGERED